jgi:hypothetical protein
MFKKKESFGLVKQINIRLNIDKYYDNEIWEKLSEELDNCYGSKNERLKMILYRGLTGERTFYTNIRNLEEIADKAVDKEEFEMELLDFKNDIREMVREEIRKAIKE